MNQITNSQQPSPATPLNRLEAREYSQKLLTKGEVAVLLRVDISTIARMMVSGRLLFVKLGKGPKSPVRFRQIDVDRFINNRSVGE